MNEISDAILTIFYRGFQLLCAWLVIVLFIPGIVWFDHAWMLVQYIIVYPSGHIFDFFVSSQDFFKDKITDDTNPLEDFTFLLLWLSCIGLTLVMPVAYWAFALFTFVVGVFGIFPALMNIPSMGPEGENIWHLVNGRTTVDETFAAEVQANAIASALKK